MFNFLFHFRWGHLSRSYSHPTANGSHPRPRRAPTDSGAERRADDASVRLIYGNSIQHRAIHDEHKRSRNKSNCRLGSIRAFPFARTLLSTFAVCRLRALATLQLTRQSSRNLSFYRTRQTPKQRRRRGAGEINAPSRASIFGRNWIGSLAGKTVVALGS